MPRDCAQPSPAAVAFHGSCQRPATTLICLKATASCQPPATSLICHCAAVLPFGIPRPAPIAKNAVWQNDTAASAARLSLAHRPIGLGSGAVCSLLGPQPWRCIELRPIGLSRDIRAQRGRCGAPGCPVIWASRHDAASSGDAATPLGAVGGTCQLPARPCGGACAPERVTCARSTPWPWGGGSNNAKT